MRDTTERTPLIDCFKATETSRKGNSLVQITFC